MQCWNPLKKPCSPLLHERAFGRVCSWPLHNLLAGYLCESVQRLGWSGIKNGELIALAESRFDVLITADQNIRYQQNLSGRKIAILELNTNNLRTLESSVELISSALASIKAGSYSSLELS